MRLEGADLRSVRADKARLTEANLRGADLRETGLALARGKPTAAKTMAAAD